MYIPIGTPHNMNPKRVYQLGNKSYFEIAVQKDTTIGDLKRR